MRSFELILLLVSWLILDLEADSKFRLVDSSGESIKVSQDGLVLYDNGTVCDNSFDKTAANIMCKELGFDFLKQWSSGKNWPELQDNYSIILDQVHDCSESKPEWSTCSYSYESNDCHHDQDVFLTCGCGGFSCPPGKYHHQSSCICMDCPSGRYKSEEGTSFCSLCPANTTSLPGSQFCSCDAGSFWNKTHCDWCGEGNASSVGALQCVTCPPESSPVENGTQCSCPFGKSWSWDMDGVGSCKYIEISFKTGLVVFGSLGGVALISLTLAVIAISLKRGGKLKNPSISKVSCTVEANKVGGLQLTEVKM